MTPEVERFMDLATRELEPRPALRDEARSELMSRISHQGLPVEMLDLSEPIEVLKNRRSGKTGLRRSAYLGGFLLLLAAFGISAGTLVRDVVFLEQAQRMGYSYLYAKPGRLKNPPAVAKWAKVMAPGLPLGSGGSAESNVALAERPDDVAMFQQHLQREKQESGADWEMSQDQLAMADRIDPDNALYDFMRMDAAANRAMGRAGRGSSTSPAVADEAEFAAALSFFAKAAEAGKFADRSGELRRRQIDAFPKSEDFLGDQIRQSFAGIVVSPSAGIWRYRTSTDELLNVELGRRVAAGDVGGVIDLRDQWLAVSRLLAEDLPHGGLDESAVTDWIVQHGKTIRDRLRESGSSDAEQETTEILNRISGQDFGYGARFPSGPPSPSERVGSWREVPSDITYDEIVPAGRTERALIDRGMTLVGCLLVLLLVVLTAFEAFRRSRQVKGLAKGLMPLLRMRDQWWIAGLGIVLPWFWFLVITRLTPLGLRDLSVDELDGVPLIVAAIQVFAAITMGASLMLWTVYRRWEKRGGFLCLRGGGTVLGLLAAGLAAIAVPAAGVIRYLGFTDDEEIIVFLLGVAGLAATGLLWLIWIGVLNLLTPKTNALRANLVSRSVLGCYMLAALTMVVGAQVLHQVERYWMARDRLLTTWSSETHLNALEERTALEWHRVLSGILGKE